MSEETAEYHVSTKGKSINDTARNTFAAYGLDILKHAVLLVLYKETDPVDIVAIKKKRSWPYPSGRILKAGEIREELNILKPQHISANTNSLIHGLLDHLRDDGYAYHYVSQGWTITDRGVSIIES